jgi:hypothetical protein
MDCEVHVTYNGDGDVVILTVTTEQSNGEIETRTVSIPYPEIAE